MAVPIFKFEVGNEDRERTQEYYIHWKIIGQVKSDSWATEDKNLDNANKQDRALPKDKTEPIGKDNLAMGKTQNMAENATSEGATAETNEGLENANNAEAIVNR